MKNHQRTDAFDIKSLTRELNPTTSALVIDEPLIKRQISEILRDGFCNYNTKFSYFSEEKRRAKLQPTQELFDREMVPIVEDFLGETTSELNRMFNTMLHQIKDRKHLNVVMLHMQHFFQNTLKNIISYFKETVKFNADDESCKRVELLNYEFNEIES